LPLGQNEKKKKEKNRKKGATITSPTKRFVISHPQLTT